MDINIGSQECLVAYQCLLKLGVGQDHRDAALLGAFSVEPTLRLLIVDAASISPANGQALEKAVEDVSLVEILLNWVEHPKPPMASLGFERGVGLSR
jgi:hypothetical protein